ncbi:Carbohydrate esterase 4 protein [Borealophlyctis nickersoniae]|nr:Carbohydrate esterase 4 protein [Borealophlyctis nickersoniae]
MVDPATITTASTTNIASTISTTTATTTTATTTTAPPTTTSVPFGDIKVITECANPGQIAITFDDGPHIYTADIVKLFDQAGGKVTFFVNGYNYGCIFDYADELKSAYLSGYQIGHHTWSHPDMQTLSTDQITTEMNKLSDALKKIIGAVPVYMRPPFGSHNAAVDQTVQALGFRYVTLWSLDAGDADGNSIEMQQQIYNSAALKTNHIVLQHDTQTTALPMVPFIISWAQSHNLQMVTVGECLGDPQENWYKDYTTPETRNPTYSTYFLLHQPKPKNTIEDRIIMHLPIELLHHIATHADPLTAGRLRRTCRGASRIVTCVDMARIEANRLCIACNGAWEALAVAVEAPTSPIPAAVLSHMIQNGVPVHCGVPEEVMVHLIPILLKMGADPNRGDGCALRGAIRCGSLPLVDYLLQNSLIDVSMHGSMGILHASQMGRGDIIMSLLRAGAVVHDWAMYCAAKLGHGDVVEVILGQGGSHEQDLVSAREAAIEGGHWQIAKRLDEAVGLIQSVNGPMIPIAVEVI